MKAKSSKLLQLMARMGQVEVRPKYLPKSNGLRVYGYCYPDGSIDVNPIPSVIDTVIHELLHSLHPEWSERSVKAQTTKLMHSMSDADVLAFWDAYEAKIGVK